MSLVCGEDIVQLSGNEAMGICISCTSKHVGIYKVPIICRFGLGNKRDGCLRVVILIIKISTPGMMELMPSSDFLPRISDSQVSEKIIVKDKNIDLNDESEEPLPSYKINHQLRELISCNFQGRRLPPELLDDQEVNLPCLNLLCRQKIIRKRSICKLSVKE